MLLASRLVLSDWLMFEPFMTTLLKHANGSDVPMD